MKTSNLEENISKYNRRSTDALGRQVDYILEVMLSKHLGEILIATERSINPVELHSKYTKKLLELQDTFNSKAEQLGTKVAGNINDNLDIFGYMTALGLIDYIQKQKESRSYKELVNLPDLVASIKGKNGADSSMLRFQFVDLVLPKTHELNWEKLEKAKEWYSKKYGNLTVNKDDEKDSEINMYYIAGSSSLKGDFENAKRKAVNSLRQSIQNVLKKIYTIEDAEALANSIDSEE